MKMVLVELDKQIANMMKHLDRTGQVWLNTGFGETVLLVLGPATIDNEGDLVHPSLVLDGDENSGMHDGAQSNWYEFDDLQPWEEDQDMKRIA